LQCEAGWAAWSGAEKPEIAFVRRFLRGNGWPVFTNKILAGSIRAGAKSVAFLERGRGFASSSPDGRPCSPNVRTRWVKYSPVRSRCGRLDQGSDALAAVVLGFFWGPGQSVFTKQILLLASWCSAKSVCGRAPICPEKAFQTAESRLEPANLLRERPSHVQTFPRLSRGQLQASVAAGRAEPSRAFLAETGAVHSLYRAPAAGVMGTVGHP